MSDTSDQTSYTPESPDTDMSGNGERMPAGPEAITNSREDIKTVERRDAGTNMETAAERGPDA